MAGDSKTEKATPKKRRDERKKGNVMMSKDAVAVVTLIGSLLMIQMMGGVMLDQIRELFRLCFSYMGPGSVATFSGDLKQLLKGAIMAFLTMARSAPSVKSSFTSSSARSF